MKCYVCDKDILLNESSSLLCSACKQLNRADLFSKILKILQDARLMNKNFNVIKHRCVNLDSVIQNYSLFIEPICIFDPEEHTVNKTALKYLRNYTKPETDNMLEKYLPIVIDAQTSSSLYDAIAFLCKLDIDVGAQELRVRNVIDMMLNCEMYHSTNDNDISHDCLDWDGSWKHFLLEHLCEKSTNVANAFSTVTLQSLSNIIRLKILSVYPKVPRVSDDLRKRLNRVFSPLDIEFTTIKQPTITLLWSNTKDIPLLPSDKMWQTDCVIHLLSKPNSYLDSAGRNFYILTCPEMHKISQRLLDKVVSPEDQRKHSEAKIRSEQTSFLKFSCPVCSKICNNYCFDQNAVTLFRQNTKQANFTCILFDATASMSPSIVQLVKNYFNSSKSRIKRTKAAVKHLLKEIAQNAGSLDEATLITFDEKLNKPSIIEICQAKEIAQESNLALIDAVRLRPRTVRTHFYSVLEEVYRMLEYKAFSCVDLYIFSDGVDTSPNKNNTAYQAIIRTLNEKLGVKCRLLDCGVNSDGLDVINWLGDPEAHCPLRGTIEENNARITTSYKKDHVKNPKVISSREQVDNSNVCQSETTECMTDKEIQSIRIPRRKNTSGDANLPSYIPSANSNSYPKNSAYCSSSFRPHTPANNELEKTVTYGIVTVRKRR